MRDLYEAVKGKVDPDKGDGILDMDLTDIRALSRELKETRDAMAILKKREDRLKTAILAHEESSFGYENDFIRIKEDKSPDMEDEGLRELLKKKGLWDQVTNVSISKPALRKAAEADEEIAAAIRWLSNRKLEKARRKKKRRD